MLYCAVSDLCHPTERSYDALVEVEHIVSAVVVRNDVARWIRCVSGGSVVRHDIRSCRPNGHFDRSDAGRCFDASRFCAAWRARVSQGSRRASRQMTAVSIRQVARIDQVLMRALFLSFDYTDSKLYYD